MDLSTIIAICAIGSALGIGFIRLIYAAIRERAVPPDIEWEDGEDRQ